jgi:L-asparaginase / beta-aspartyl-peptidase
MAFAANTPNRAKFVLAVHGGLAWPRVRITDEHGAAIRAALNQSLAAGYDVLKRDSAGSVDAVAAAVKVLEDSPLFNAGRGSIFNQRGMIEMDAAIMEGKARRAGAVAAVQRIRNPVMAARAVMTESKAVLLVGEAADSFAEQAGLEMASPDYFRTEIRWNDFLARRAAQQGMHLDKPISKRNVESKGTVGAVALDAAGNLAAATSTGGVTYKLAGRVGDSAVIGAGTFADNRTCAVSATGDGELFIRTSAGFSVSARMQYQNLDVARASQEAVDDIRELGGQGGMIVIDRDGNVAMPYHAEGMYRGSIDADGEVQIALLDT